MTYHWIFMEKKQTKNNNMIKMSFQDFQLCLKNLSVKKILHQQETDIKKGLYFFVCVRVCVGVCVMGKSFFFFFIFLFGDANHRGNPSSNLPPTHPPTQWKLLSEKHTLTHKHTDVGHVVFFSPSPLWSLFRWHI